MASLNRNEVALLVHMLIVGLLPAACCLCTSMLRPARPVVLDRCGEAPADEGAGAGLLNRGAQARG